VYPSKGKSARSSWVEGEEQSNPVAEKTNGAVWDHGLAHTNQDAMTGKRLQAKDDRLAVKLGSVHRRK
jgi:hypothetical protein